MKARILIAEDDRNIRLGLVATLESEGYVATAASDGAQAQRLLAQASFDLVMLDVMMPKLSGYDVCRELRQRDARVPVLFLTAKGEEIDKVVGLKLGADDYMTKPFGVHELLARVEALLRRAKRNLGAERTDNLPSHFALGEATIDRAAFRVVREGRESALTLRELKLATVFAMHPGQVLTRDQLLNAAWGIDYLGTTRTLDQHMVQLRRKIEADPENPCVLVTVHGVGYRYVVETSREA